MAGREKGTREKIMNEALRLFAREGYAGTSMNDIAAGLGITKAALYKHYEGKQEILESIIEKMNLMDEERVKKYNMPEGRMDEIINGYRCTPFDKIREFTRVQFLHWTEEEFSADFRRLLTLEQYRDEKMGKLYQRYLGEGPLSYIEAIFKGMIDDDLEAAGLALEFYGPIFLLYSIYDAGRDRERTLDLLDRHVDYFDKRFKGGM